MTGVFSLWCAPRKGRPFSVREARMMALSYGLARRAFSRLSIVCDREGLDAVQALGFEFDHVDACLDDLSALPPRVWAFGKIYAYARQKEPFCHLDWDVFLFSPLPDGFLGSALFAQSPETPAARKGWDRQHVYRPDLIAIPFATDAWRAHVARGNRTAYNTGITGGTRTDFFRPFWEDCVAMLQASQNQPAWQRMSGTAIVLHLEQWYFGALAETMNIPIATLLSDDESEEEAVALGYCHLLSGSKRHPVYVEKIAARLAQEFPQLEARCVALDAKVK